ncbi:unnamed protein product [Calicophoron daubneyi]|uniref:Uncharacterized protein n=1 Tax=Calicophoron daubneyi TaxID=300641 RepID=A0AAV2TC31_CALDB
MACAECAENCEIENPRNLVSSVASGLLFALAWWLAIDAACVYSKDDQLPPAFHTPGVFGTIAFILINCVPNSALHDEYGTGRIGRRGALVCLFIAFLTAFASVIAACWILFGGYVAMGKTPVWPGVAILLQNLFLCIAAVLFRFGRKDEE